MRFPKQWLIGVIATAVIALLILPGMPRKYRSSGCLFCGCRYEERWWFGVKTFDRVWEPECSAWVRSIHPDHSNHIWATASTKQRGWGFPWSAWTVEDYASAAGAIPQIHILRAEYGEARARDFLDRYHAQLSLDRSSLVKWLRTEFEAFDATNGIAPKAP